MAVYRAWDSIITVEIAWTRVHAISDYNTCANTHLSDVDRKARRSLRGDRRRAYLHQLKIARSRSNGLQWSRVEARERRIFITIIADRTAQMNRGRTLRSRCDRAAIVARSNRDLTAFVADSFQLAQTAFPGASGARSAPDQSPIAARSWSIVAEIVVFLEADLKPNSCGFFVELKPRRRTQRLVLMTPSNDAHDRLYCSRFRA